MLVTYPEGEQLYGKDYFTDLKGILRYFDMNYLEYGEIVQPMHGMVRRTYFVGRYGAIGATRL
jgi:hypothetical protein